MYWAKTRVTAAATVLPMPNPVIAPPERPAPQTPHLESPPAIRPRPPERFPRIFFRHNAVDSNYGRVGVLGFQKGATPEFAGSLQCEVLYVAGGKGICLTADRGVLTTYAAELFDAYTFEKTATIPLHGAPSRCRVSRDGHLAAATVFVTGHAYTSLNFSTQTLLINTKTAGVTDIESFSVMRDGAAFHDTDFNFWGVTFTPGGDQFYCTLSSKGKHYLVKADIASRKATVIQENVECPSLSPDDMRIAYKKRFQSGGRIQWQLHILDLASGRETPLDEKRSVDDQLEWLDNERLLYALPVSDSSASSNVWVASANGSRVPEVFLTNAYSPAVAR